MKLYYSPEPGPCRAVLMVLHELDLVDRVDLAEVNLIRGETKTKEFRQLNPQGTIPTLVVDDDEDGGGRFVLWESRAIIKYLADRFRKSGDGGGGRDVDLYPQDIRTRATIDRLLDFDLCKVGRATADYQYPLMMDPGRTDLEDKLTALRAVLAILNTMLEGRQYISDPPGTLRAASGRLTLADLSIAARVGCLEAVVSDPPPFTADHENVTRWMDHLAATLPYWAAVNTVPLARMRQVLEIRRQKTKEESK